MQPGPRHIMETPPCRLFVFTARDAPIAIVARRGPSKWYHVLRWHTKNDTFEPGAWFHGRIYEDRCDLSPDGSLMVYFCHGGAWRPDYTAAWTAVQGPWLHAPRPLALGIHLGRRRPVPRQPSALPPRRRQYADTPGSSAHGLDDSPPKCRMPSLHWRS